MSVTMAAPALDLIDVSVVMVSEATIVENHFAAMFLRMVQLLKDARTMESA